MTDKTKKLKKSQEHLDGIDGYYHTGEVNSQTFKGNENLRGEVDQYAFRGEYSLAQHSHGQPEYAVEEEWREWGKGRYESFKNSRIKEEEQELYNKVCELLDEKADIESLSVSVFEGDIFVSGRVKGNFVKSEFTDMIKEIEGVNNVVNHLSCVDSQHGPYRVMSQELGIGEEGRR